MTLMNSADIDLNLLRVLDALLDTGSVVGAAAQLHLSSPAVSHYRDHLTIEFPIGSHRFNSTIDPPEATINCSGFIGKTSFHVPAAAQTSSYCNKSGSTNTRSCVL
jgi:hypothetical protein